MASLRLSMALLVAVAGTKIGEMEQGAEFTKCVTITDFQTKTLDDDITLVDRESGGCCPDDSVPGAKFYSQYQGAQIVCGFKDDGTVALTTGSSGGAKTCTYNKCYVMKQNIECKDGTKQLLNGCCGAKPQSNFKTDCKFYDKNFNSVYGDKTQYCLTYHKTYKMENTAVKTDDIKDGKLQVDKIYTYTACAGSAVTGGGASPSPGSPAPAATSGTTRAVAAAGAAGLFAAALALLRP